MSKAELSCRCFISYTGVKLPLRLVNELDEESIDKRITYFNGFYDQHGQLKILEKVVYGEIEFSHQYEYDDTGRLCKAVLSEADELPRTLVFDEQGNAVEVSTQ